MGLSPGTRLGSYEVVSELGAGGMGEVYRARDPELRRDVAVKIIHPRFCHDPERVARFRHEARSLAALNHPHVAAIYEFGDCEGTCFLVMELVPGETLQEKLSHEGLSVPDALRLCTQVAAALEAAHEKGLVHRDLKPANIRITPDGIAKVLDFGLAKTLGSDESLTGSPTVRTDHGAILGTAAYMSPEQARGKPVDRQSDIWAFGCVMFEMLASRRAFSGDTVSDSLVQILQGEPDWRLLPPETPPSILRLLRRCLQKDPHHRLRDIGDARLEIEEALAAPVHSPDSAPVAASRRWTLAYGLTLALGAVAGAAIGAMLRGDVSAPARPAAHFLVPLPPGERLAGLDFPAVAISPDGSQLAYVAARGGGTQLFLRPMGGLEASPIAGTTDAISPFFSPDSRWIAFFTGGKLKKVLLPDGPPITVCDAAIGFGGSWGNGDTIVFSSTTGSPLFQVPAEGGTPTQVTTLNAAKGEFSHRWPTLLPDGDTVLFTVGMLGSWDDAEIVAQSLSTGRQQGLLKGGTHPQYLPSGHLVYARAGAIMAVPFDADRLAVTGPAAPVLENVMVSSDGAAQLSVSATGGVVYVPGSSQGTARRLVAVDPAGMVTPYAAPARAYTDPRISPDGGRLLVTVTAAKEDVWMYDIRESSLKQLTFDADNSSAIWTPDGERITYNSSRAGARSIYMARTDGGGAAERLTSSESVHRPASWSPDGAVLAFVEHHPVTGLDIWMLRYRRNREASPFVRTSSDEGAPRFSPDGRSVAYVSNESGRSEVYVRQFDDPVRAWQVSREGGTEPVWSAAGRELFYRAGDRLMAVPVEPGRGFRAGAPRVVVEAPFERGAFGRPNYDVTPGTPRFVFVAPVEQGPTEGQLHVLLNWAESIGPVVSRASR